jgi:hypothetical protein
VVRDDHVVRDADEERDDKTFIGIVSLLIVNRTYRGCRLAIHEAGEMFVLVMITCTMGCAGLLSGGSFKGAAGAYSELPTFRTALSGIELPLRCKVACPRR